jgi:hypothetical protein
MVEGDHRQRGCGGGVWWIWIGHEERRGIPFLFGDMGTALTKEGTRN